MTKKFMVLFLLVLSFYSCSSDDDSTTPETELSQEELLVNGKWSFREEGLIVNDALVPEGEFACDDQDFMEFNADKTYYESDFSDETGTCVDDNVDDKGTWELDGSRLNRVISFEGIDNTENLTEQIRQLDANNLILFDSQTDEDGNPETYYIYYTH